MSAVRSLLALAAFVLLCLGVGAIGSLLTTPALEPWYASLQKPTWTPPSAVFGPVWTVLYILMGVAAWLVWRERGSLAAAAIPLALFGAQLALNLAWSGIFFGLQRPGLAFAEIVVLWVAIVATLVSFWRVTPWAGALLIPYLLWVTYAAALNFAIWQMNAGAALPPS